ncbi:Transcription elongation factor 1 protein [Dioscorea alata]|uniref:Transcription elongation factor 1 protein n=1 Tax=Dioscorea alata TaxID=55571 RepID=A0ACB7UU79_DIOAL|nr:Transcription elongation factor 1 protein [Dioscorea alata]
MAKRKSRMPKLLPKKKMPKLDVIFKCPFCESNDAVTCSIDLKDHYGAANCVFCEARYSTTANHLTKPIDIYSEWIDKCHEVNKEAHVLSFELEDTADSASSII